jgi:hypothetical protein
MSADIDASIYCHEVPEIIETTREAYDTAGYAWGATLAKLSQEHIDALLAGKTLSVDVESEYTVFIRLESAR